MSVREIREKATEIHSMGTLIFLVNEMPPIEGNVDDATVHRFKMTEWESRWIEPNEAPKTEAEQDAKRLYPMDIEFDQKLPTLSSAFVWLLVQDYKMFCENGTDIDCFEIKQHTKNYWNSRNKYIQFINESVDSVELPDKQPDPSSKIACTEMWKNFRSWFYLTVTNRKSLPDEDVFRTNLSKHIGDPDKASGLVLSFDKWPLLSNKT